MNNTSQKGKGNYTIGRGAFAKISAVEGIQLTKEMRRDFQMFDEKGLSSKDRRDAIAKKYAR